jgi:hypothetical protein
MLQSFVQNFMCILDVSSSRVQTVTLLKCSVLIVDVAARKRTAKGFPVSWQQ